MKRYHNIEDKSLLGFVRQCPLTTLLILSFIGYTLYAIAGGIDGEYKLRISKDHPLFLSAMIPDDPFLDQKEPTTEQPTTEALAQSTPTDAVASATDVADDENTNVVYTSRKNPIPVAFETVEKRIAKSPYYDDNDKVALTTSYDYIDVDASYFDDAAFIGDSRIEGLHDYGTFKNRCNADFYYKNGISIWKLLDETMDNGSTVVYGLSSKQYNKIYIMCGVNELGNGYASDYQEQYKKVLDKIRELQPSAMIFVMGIMHVSQSYSDGSTVFNNDNIDCRNALVAQYCDGKNIFYLDMNESVCDMNGSIPGALKSEYTGDGIHLTAQYYTLWEDYLLKHGLRDDMFPALSYSNKQTRQETTTQTPSISTQ